MEKHKSPQQPVILSDKAVINAITTTLVFSADGVLRWMESGQRCLTVEKEVLGFMTDGLKLKIRAIVLGQSGICCVGNGEVLVRKDFTFKLFSMDSLLLWCQKLREYIDCLGNYISVISLSSFSPFSPSY